MSDNGPQNYDDNGYNLKDGGVKEFVKMGCADDPDGEECDELFEYASSIANHGAMIRVKQAARVVCLEQLATQRTISQSALKRANRLSGH